MAIGLLFLFFAISISYYFLPNASEKLRDKDLKAATLYTLRVSNGQPNSNLWWNMQAIVVCNVSSAG